MRMLHMAYGKANPRVWSAIFCRALGELGEFELVEDAGAMSAEAALERIRQADVVLGSWNGLKIPDAIAENPGRVRYLCHVNGAVRGFISGAHIHAGIPVTNWGDSPANDVAEGAMCLLLATLKSLHTRIDAVRSGGGPEICCDGGTLRNLNVGIYGLGVIGRRFLEMIRPFGCVLRVFDPFVTEFPDFVTPVKSLTELFQNSEAIVVHAGLTASTRGSVTSELLALLPRHGIVINTARGDIIDQGALFRELESGRLRAGLDVLAEPEQLPPDHPARRWPNLIWTCHQIEHGWPTDGQPPRKLERYHEICLENLKRFRDGQPIRFIMDPKRFELST